ncbi:rme1-like gtpase ATPase without a c-terminal eh domain [Chrysochromulina tobinii]|jgi:hypothetical protein|uniref:Rme1-like gtpase ATPase without a c-terminal eh domain n=1 Tax=Chrysochromulina tobinii TaxID=1460289 RepID=A0A0M0KAB6_9EUKA|nr:rme1-like gtpase ATPase without a c-terminal eh domain [Chrysochromulina tobinii]|eukprot:KOO35358.1 rme1-like gtpase ATPase without a c-terminal eh domain [Chrysochromulina sp. CCMP291]
MSGFHGRLPYARFARQLHASSSAARHVKHVKQVTEQLHETVLAPLNSRLHGPLERRPFTEGIPLPSVLLLGNHSSGKSSFINFVLGRNVQATGVAPTDDGFTVIAPGAEDADRDGPSFIGDPGLGFAPLRVFGPAFMSHFHLKVRSGLATQLLLIDSPGMIDSPATSARPALGVDWSTTERGYDFLRVTQWLAEHADVILLFFDPDKPGTTGETLQCLTTSLRTQEHKLHIIMNKVDQFVHIHDFARAYGSLCWNLSKVIPRKDLPRIYTMYLPPSALKGGAGARASAMQPGGAAASSLSHALAELSSTRDEVLHAVRAAPERRVDNLITRTHDAAAMLRMHAVVLEEARAALIQCRRQYAASAGALLAVAPAAAYTMLHGPMSDLALVPLSSVSVAAGSAGLFLGLAALAALRGRAAFLALHAQLASAAGLDEIFERLHAIEVNEADEFALSLWRRVRPQLQRAIATLALTELAPLSSGERYDLDNILQGEVPKLRRLTSSHPEAEQGTGQIT